MEKYPDAKVLLTVRDPDRWYESAFNTIYPAGKIFRPWIGWISPLKYLPLMFNHLLWEGTFGGKFEDKPYVIDVFNKHIEQVKSCVPPDKLLVYDVKQGWEPLCRFLNVPIPEGKPFPHLNDTKEFNNRMSWYNRIMQLVPIVLLLLILFIVRLFMRRK